MGGPRRRRRPLAPALLPALPPALLLALLLALAGCAEHPKPPGPPGDPVAAVCLVTPTPGPADLACRIRAGEAVLHDPAATAEARAAAGSDTEAAYRRLAEHPDWDAGVLADLGPVPRSHVEHAVAAQRELTALAGPPHDTVPAWRVVEPPPLPELRAHYAEAQARFGVPWTVLAAINLVETRMGRVVGLSVAGAQGPMQFMPGTWARYGLGGDVWDTRDAVLGAANYLAANGGNRDAGLDRALRRYNNDVRYVRAVRQYAAMLAEDPVALDGVYAWPVRFRTVVGDLLLPVGYAQTRSIPVTEWLATPPK